MQLCKDRWGTQHAAYLTSLQSGSHLGDDSHSSDKPRNHRENWTSPEAAAMYIDTERTFTSPIYGKTYLPKTTPVIMMHQSTHQKESTLRSSPSNYATVAPSADNVIYCRLCIAFWHRASTCPLLSAAAPDLIINQRRSHWENPPPENSYRLGSRFGYRSPRSIGESTPRSFLQKTEGRTAIAEASQEPIVQETVVPGTIAKSHRERHRLLL